MGNFRPARLPANLRNFVDQFGVPSAWLDFENDEYFYPFFKPDGFLNYPGASASGGVNGTVIRNGLLTSASAPRIGDGGLVVEEESINNVRGCPLFEEGSAATGTTWASTNAIISASSDAPFDGQTSALVSRDAVANSFIRQQASSYVVGDRASFSVYAKAGPNGDRLGMRMQGVFPSRADAVFDLSSGVVVGVSSVDYADVTADIISVGAGWYRCWLISSIAGTNFTRFVLGPTDSSKGVGLWETPLDIPNDVLVYGAQSEPDASVSSLIFTGDGPVTRTAGSVTLATANLGWADDAEVDVTYADGSTGTLTAVAGTLTIPASAKAYARITA